MNKTISINLGGRNFFIEEDAYKKLEGYLNAIKARFAEYQGSSEIVADMESRIGEKFAEKYEGASQAVITLGDVESLISELGSVEDIAGEPAKGGSASGGEAGKNFAPKRLMRNGDDKIVAGVASGLAAYFDIDPIIFRIIFAILIFAWGAIIPIYFLLWLIMPEAKTPTEKMQMRGEPLNINSLGETIKERAEEFKTHVNNVKTNEEWKKWKQDMKEQGRKMKEDIKQSTQKWKEDYHYSSQTNSQPKTQAPSQTSEGSQTMAEDKGPASTQGSNRGEPEPARRRGGFGNFLRQIFQGIGRILLFFLMLLRRIISLALIIAFAAAMAGVTIAFAVAISGASSPYMALPLQSLAHNAPFYILLIIAYIIILVPLQFLLLLSVGIFNGFKSVFRASVGFTLFGIWLAALVVGGAVGARYIPGYVEQIKNSPQLQTVSRSYDVKDFNKLSLSNSGNFKLIQSDHFGVTASGWAGDLDRLDVNVNGDTLSVGSHSRFCIFCISKSPQVEITAPDFLSITAKNSSSVRSDSIVSTSTTLTLQNSSDAEINYTVKNLDLSLSNSSDANLSGQADTLKAQLRNSSDLNAYGLMVKDANVTTSNSSEAQVNVSGTLMYESFNSSEIYYSGNPTIITNSDTEPFENSPIPQTP